MKVLSSSSFSRMAAGFSKSAPFKHRLVVLDELGKCAGRLSGMEPTDHLRKRITRPAPFAPENLIGFHIHTDGLCRHACTLHARGLFCQGSVVAFHVFGLRSRVRYFRHRFSWWKPIFRSRSGSGDANSWRIASKRLAMAVSCFSTFRSSSASLEASSWWLDSSSRS